MEYLSSLLCQATRLAAQAHDGAYRKGGRAPYLLHVMETAEIVGTMTEDEDVLAAAVLHEIEAASHLAACGVVNNSHLCDETAEKDVETGRAWARSVADELALPLVATCVPARLAKTCNYREAGSEPLVVVGRYVNTPWQ